MSGATWLIDHVPIDIPLSASPVWGISLGIDFAKSALYLGFRQALSTSHDDTPQLKLGLTVVCDIKTSGI